MELLSTTNSYYNTDTDTYCENWLFARNIKTMWLTIFGVLLCWHYAKLLCPIALCLCSLATHSHLPWLNVVFFSQNSLCESAFLGQILCVYYILIPKLGTFYVDSITSTGRHYANMCESKKWLKSSSLSNIEFFNLISIDFHNENRSHAHEDTTICCK